MASCSLRRRPPATAMIAAPSPMYAPYDQLTPGPPGPVEGLMKWPADWRRGEELEGLTTIRESCPTREAGQVVRTREAEELELG